MSPAMLCKSARRRSRAACGVVHLMSARVHKRLPDITPFFNLLDRLLPNPQAVLHSRGMVYWDCFCAILLSYICFATPIEVAFMDPYLGFLFVWNRIIDFIFLIDMLLQFCLPIQKTERKMDILITDRRKIFSRYLHTWFLADLLSIAPFDVLSVGMRGNASGAGAISKLKVLRVIRLLRIVKLVRLLKGLRIWKRYQLQMGISYRKMMLGQLCFSIVVAAHWIACALGFFSRLQGEACIGLPSQEGFDPAENVDCAITWASIALLQRNAARDEFEGEKTQLVKLADFYMLSLETSISILVHPYFVRAIPRNTTQVAIFAVLMVCGGFMWTRLLSRSTALFSSLGRHSTIQRQTMDDINAIMAEQQLSQELRVKIRGFFMHMKDISLQASWKDILKRMSPKLRRDTIRESNSRWLNKISFFLGLPGKSRIAMMTDVAMTLQSEHYGPKEPVGEMFRMYIVSRGAVQKFGLRSGAWDIKRVGDVWGEEHVMLSQPQLLDDNTALSCSYLQVKTISRAELANIIDGYPDCHVMLRKHFVRCLFKIAILRKADEERKRRALERSENTQSIVCGSGGSQIMRKVSISGSRSIDEAAAKNLGLTNDRKVNAFGSAVVDEQDAYLSEEHHEMNFHKRAKRSSSCLLTHSYTASFASGAVGPVVAGNSRHMDLDSWDGSSFDWGPQIRARITRLRRLMNEQATKLDRDTRQLREEARDFEVRLEADFQILAELARQRIAGGNIAQMVKSNMDHQHTLGQRHSSSPGECGKTGGPSAVLGSMFCNAEDRHLGGLSPTAPRLPGLAFSNDPFSFGAAAVAQVQAQEGVASSSKGVFFTSWT